MRWSEVKEIFKEYDKKYDIEYLKEYLDKGEFRLESNRLG